MTYRQSYKNQNWLLPVRVEDLIPDDHLCFFVENFVDNLDYKKFDYGVGNPSYHPRILMKVLVYGMLSKIKSFRKLSRATRENVIFMYLSEKLSPDFRTIARFRKNNLDFIKSAFKESV